MRSPQEFRHERSAEPLQASEGPLGGKRVHANDERGGSMTDTLLQLDQVTRSYTLPRERLWGPAPQVHAVRGVSLRMQSGSNLGIVGESGSGKSTLARLVMALEAPNSGSVRMLGQDLNQLGAAALRQARLSDLPMLGGEILFW